MPSPRAARTTCRAHRSSTDRSTRRGQPLRRLEQPERPSRYAVQLRGRAGPVRAVAGPPPSAACSGSVAGSTKSTRRSGRGAAVRRRGAGCGARPCPRPRARSRRGPRQTTAPVDGRGLLGLPLDREAGSRCARCSAMAYASTSARGPRRARAAAHAACARRRAEEGVTRRRPEGLEVATGPRGDDRQAGRHRLEDGESEVPSTRSGREQHAGCAPSGRGRRSGGRGIRRDDVRPRSATSASSRAALGAVTGDLEAPAAVGEPGSPRTPRRPARCPSPARAAAPRG